MPEPAHPGRANVCARAAGAIARRSNKASLAGDEMVACVIARELVRLMLFEVHSAA
jgi:hypothetical protein